MVGTAAITREHWLQMRSLERRRLNRRSPLSDEGPAFHVPSVFETTSPTTVAI